MNINTFNEKANEKTKLNEGIVTFLKDKGLVWEIDGTDKQVLTKGGAELLAEVFELNVQISNPETKTVDISGQSYEYVHIVANVHDHKGNLIGKGVGGRSMYEDGYNLNTTLKMAAKSAYVDGVIRALKLSSALTQDGVSEPLIPVTSANQSNTQNNADKAAATAAAVQQAKEADTKERVELMTSIVNEADGTVDELVAMFGVSKIEEVDTVSLRQMLEMIRTAKSAVEQRETGDHSPVSQQTAYIPDEFIPDPNAQGNNEFTML